MGPIQISKFNLHVRTYTIIKLNLTKQFGYFWKLGNAQMMV